MRKLAAATAIALIMSTTPAYAYRSQSGHAARDRAYDAEAKRATSEAAKNNAAANQQNLETLNKMGPVGTSEDPHSDLISWATGQDKSSVRRWMEMFLAVLPPVLDVLCGVAMVEICLAVHQANRQDEEEERKRREEAEKKGAAPVGGGRLEPMIGALPKPAIQETVILNDNKPSKVVQKGERDGGKALRAYAKADRPAGKHVPQGRKIPEGIPSPQEIKDLRATLGLTQETLAKRLVNEEGKPIATGTVSNWEQGAQAPSDFMLVQFNELRREAARKGGGRLAA